MKKESILQLCIPQCNILCPRLSCHFDPPLHVCCNDFPSACVSASGFLCVSVCVAACCASGAWAAAPMLLMISSHIPVTGNLDSPLSAPVDQPSAVTGLAWAFRSYFQHTHTHTHTPSGSLLPTPTTSLTHTVSSSPTLFLPSVSIVLSWISREQPVARVVETLCSIQRARFGSSLAEDRQSKAHTLDFQAPL